MKKIIVILFSLICLVAYPQRKNEYGQKMVKNVKVYGNNYKDGCGLSYQFTYDDNNRTTSVKAVEINKKNEIIYTFDYYILENGKLVYYTNWCQGNGIEKSDNQFILNDKGHLIQEIQIFPAEKEVWNFYYDEDISIYDENLVKVEYIETDKNGNYFIGPLGNTVTPLIVKEGDYTEPSNKYYEFKPLNNTNITLFDIIARGETNILYLTTWVPYYYPWVPTKNNYKGEECVKFEYYYDENDNISKILRYELESEGYKLKRKIEIEYLY